MERIILVVNPGSASRKYSIFKNQEEILKLHFEKIKKNIICNITSGSLVRVAKTELLDISHAGKLVKKMVEEELGLKPINIEKIGIRIVAPSSFFMSDHEVDNEVKAKLEFLKNRAPIHIKASLNEIEVLEKSFPMTKIFAISDSAFHSTKPDYAWNYGLPIEDADKYELKRFGYHGIAVGSAINTIKDIGKLTPKIIVCHIGSGVSVSAIFNSHSVDTTMGYSPLEGVIMSTRSGSLDLTAADVLKDELHLSQHGLIEYLNNSSGLLGLSGLSGDIRELLKAEDDGNSLASLALRTFIHSLQKAIGQMTAVLGGVDMLVFTGMVGERSAIIRQRIIKPFHFLDLTIDHDRNKSVFEPQQPENICTITHSKPVFVVPTDEAKEIVRRLYKF